jgi:putative DNA primase/helicase
MSTHDLDRAREARTMRGLSARDTALALLSRHNLWPVAIRPGGKAPIGESWGATRPTERSIRETFQRFPKAGVGLLLGPETGIIDIECDGPEGETSLARLMGGEIIPTLGWSSRRGPHHIFRHDPRLGRHGKSSIKLPELPGLEIRVGGDGKQLQSNCPPTIGIDGKPREWNGNEIIADLPEAVFRFLDAALIKPKGKAGIVAPTPPATSALGAYVARALDDECQAVASAPDGVQNATLFKAAISHGQFVGAAVLDRSEAEQRLRDAAAGYARKDGEAQARATIQSGLNRGVSQPRDLSHVGTGRNVAPPGPGTAAPPVASRPPDFDGPPRPLGVELLPVPALDPAMLPDAFRGWLADSAERMSAPLDYLAAPAMVALAAVVGLRICVRPKAHDDWTVCPNLWGAIVGPPSVLKSPCAEEALRPLNRLAMDALKQHEPVLDTFKEDLLITKMRAEGAKAELKKVARRQGAADGELRRLAQEAVQAENLKPPPAPRYIVNDTTVEKLGELLAENPNGLLLFRDELTGFFRSLDRQGHENDRKFYLETWNGFGSYVYDRIGRGTIFIPSICMSIFGGIQPGPLARYLRAAASGDDADGFIPRFQLLVFPDLPSTWTNVDRWPDTEAKNRAYRVFQALASLAPEASGTTRDQGRDAAHLRFDPEAQSLYDEWRADLEYRLLSGCDGPLIAAHLAKYRSLMPTLALLFHLVEVVSSRACPGPIPRTSALAAAAWCEYLEAHARRVYQGALDGDPETAERLARRIRSGALPNPFRARDVVRKGWAGLDRVEVVERTLLVLEDRNWVQGVESLPSPMGGRPTVDYWINPAIQPSTPGGGDNR